MLAKIKAGWQVMQAGKRVADPVAWKRGQINASYLKAFLAAVLVALAAFTGLDIQVADVQLDAIAVGVAGIVAVAVELCNVIATVASTNKIGLSGERKPGGGD